MRLVWQQRPNLERKLELAKAFGAGLPKSIDYEIVEGLGLPDGDVLVLFGIGGVAKQIWDAWRNAGRKVIFIDKGYTRKTGHWRVSVNAFQPLAYFQANRPSDRFDRLGLLPESYHLDGEAILFDGASTKFCQWQGLGDLTEWGARTVDRIRAHTDAPIIYRPRPIHNEPVAVPGAELSCGPLQADFDRSRVVVSYGGNIGWDAVISGLPHFAIGDSIARPISETRWPHIDRPRIPTEDERMQWLYDVSYCQWTVDEISSGEAWDQIRRVL